jgi:2-polyprenyl-6-methoxyphenol hydroxylase-like FAD-dependent oxidoreductase
LESALVVFAGAGRKAMMVPLGPRSAGLAITVPAGLGQRIAPYPQARDLRAAARVFPELVRNAAARLPDHASVVVRPVVGELLAEPWHRGPYLCVGACAHALPPQFGQAAAQAIEDAVVLHDLLQQPLAASVLAARFTARRSPRARRVFDATIQAARWDVSPDDQTDLRSLAEQLAQIVADPA